MLRTETTVGGGTRARPGAAALVRSRAARVLERGTPEEILRALVREPVTGASLQARGLFAPAELARGLAALEQAGDWFFAPRMARRGARGRHVSGWRGARSRSPLDPGLPLAELLPPEPWAPSVAAAPPRRAPRGKAFCPAQRRHGSARRRRAAAATRSGARRRTASSASTTGSSQPTSRPSGRLKRVGDGLAVSAELYERGREALHELDPITLAAFRDALGISRRTAQLLLERFDADGLTRRVGDERVLRRSATRG